MEKKTLILLSLIFLLALLLRLLVVGLGVGFDRELSFFDARDYDRHAMNFLAGKGLTNGHAWASRSPIYPLFLALLYRLFGHSYLAVRLVQSLLGASLVFLCYPIFRLYFSERVSLGGILCCALHPLLVIYAGNILSENLGLFLLALFLFVFLRSRGVVSLWVGGILFGILQLSRAPLIFFLPFILRHLCKERGGTACVGFLLAFLLTLSPWALRNYRILHAFVPFTTNGGTTFWDANNPKSLGAAKMGLASEWLMPGKVMKQEGDQEVLLSEVEGDHALFRKGFAFLKDLLKKDPLLFIYFLLRKALAAFSLHSGKGLFALFGFGLLYLVCLPLGIWKSFHLEKRPVLLYGIMLQYLLSSLIFFGRAKYRLVIEPYLLPFIILALSRLFSRSRC